MAQSPVEFAVAFEKLRSRIATGAGSDDAILSLIDFWPRLKQLGKNSAYSSYLAEYLAYLESSLRDGGYGDLTIDELRQLEAISLTIGVDAESITNVCKQIARLCFYVGDLSEGLRVCLRITNESLTLKSDLDLEANLSEIERFGILVDHFGDAAPNTKSILLRLLNDWQSEREFVSTGRIHSLLVQHSSVGDRPRGKLRVLTGSIEERGSHSANDEITFDNQLRAADDPIVGVAYHALAAIRSYFKATGYPKLGSQYYHAHLALAEREATYTGDSIGIATALLAYAQLLHTQALRHDHLLPGDIACTGGIDEPGMVTPVNSDSLQAKVERVFFSHIKYLVLPAANLAQARQYLDAMLVKYPSRHLILLPVASLSAIINDHNIVRPEKLCIGEFVAKSAVRYSRMTKVQVPMLAVLAYLLLCVIYPKAWVFPVGDSVSIMKTQTGATIVDHLNKQQFEVKTACQNLDLTNRWKLLNLDDDPRNELLFVVSGSISERCDDNAKVMALDDSGAVLWQEMCYGSAPSPLAFTGADGLVSEIVDVHNSQNGPIIAVCTIANNPARNFLRLLDANGRVKGEYLQRGTVGIDKQLMWIGDSVFVALGWNNSENACCLFAIYADSANGIAPGFILNDATQGIMGKELAYISFACSDVSQIDIGTYHTQPEGIWVKSGREITVLIYQSSSQEYSIWFTVDQRFRVTEVSPADDWIEYRKRKVKSGELPERDVQEQMDSLILATRYFRDSIWVTEAELRSRSSHLE